MSKKEETEVATYFLEWENDIKGRPHGYREEPIITREEWDALEPREKIKFTHLTDDEKRAYVAKLRGDQDE